jgi:hypothetical protein
MEVPDASAAADQATTEADLSALTHAWIDAINAKDRAKLELLISSDYQLRTIIVMSKSFALDRSFPMGMTQSTISSFPPPAQRGAEHHPVELISFLLRHCKNPRSACLFNRRSLAPGIANGRSDVACSFVRTDVASFFEGRCFDR